MIRIHPLFNAYYYSFYIEGLRDVFGARNLRYDTRGDWPLAPHSLCFEVDGKRIYLSAGDGPGFNPEGLLWADVYAKVNIDPNALPERHHEKIMPIGPSFGIHNYGLAGTLIRMARTSAMITAAYGDVRKRFLDYWPREHFANHWRQYKHRLPLSVYQPTPSERDYVFFVGSLWKRETQTNEYRARFMEVCRRTPGLRFEGGFPPRNDMHQYDHLIMQGRVPFARYIENTKRSALAFSTPAVQGCLGWKLAEFLALGKAIISTDLGRVLPAPMLHGEHIHFVDGSEASIREAVERITGDDTYRGKLEAGARVYYDAYLAPRRVIERVIDAAMDGLTTPIDEIEEGAKND
jgi:glycosyltransferase involved in cell wall biosynthesis